MFLFRPNKNKFDLSRSKNIKENTVKLLHCLGNINNNNFASECIYLHLYKF